MKDTGSEVKTLVAFTPRSISGEVAMSGSVIDRKGYESAVFTCVSGNYTSTPTAINVECKVQQCATPAGSFADVTDLTDALLPVIHTHISGEVTTTREATAEINMDLRPCERYVKLVVAADFTGGSSPNLFFGATVTLGEPRIMPAI